MGFFNHGKRNGGFVDEIRCDEPSYLIWKWHPTGTKLGETNRENAIRIGSSLRVKDGEVAVFVYRQDDGVMQDFIVGPFDMIIKTSNFPILSGILGKIFDGGTPFQAEVYFINLARIIQIKFGVPFFDIFDSRFPDFGIPVAIRGSISFKIDDFREFIKINRLTNFSLDDLHVQIRSVLNNYVKQAVIKETRENNISVFQVESNLAKINELIQKSVEEKLREQFGIKLSSIDIGNIEIDKMSEGYNNLAAITKNVTLATIEAQANAEVNNISDKQRIESKNYEEILKIQRDESQYSQHKTTQTANYSAYKTEAQTEVGVAGANALGNMSRNGASGINLGDNGAGFNPVNIMAGMVLGGAIGQNIAGIIGEGMSSEVAPIPSPQIEYYLAVNNQATGPFDIKTLKVMSISKQFTKESLVWKPGLQTWVIAEEVNELNSLFSAEPPALPTK